MGKESEKYVYIYAAAATSLQSYPTLCDPIDGSPAVSSIPGILQARVLEWGAIAFSVYIYIYTCTNTNVYIHIYAHITVCTYTHISSVQFSRSVVSDSLQPHALQHARPPCPSPTPRAYSNSCPSSGWCHPTISSSVVPFSSCLQSLPASGSFPLSQFFSSGGQRIGASASASVFPMNTQDWFSLGWTGFLLDLLAVQGTLKINAYIYT